MGVGRRVICRGKGGFRREGRSDAPQGDGAERISHKGGCQQQNSPHILSLPPQQNRRRPATSHVPSLCNTPQARTGAHKKAAARDDRLAGKESAKRKSKNSEQNHVTTVNVLIGYFSRTMGSANLVFSGLCHSFVPHFVAHILKNLNVSHL